MFIRSMIPKIYRMAEGGEGGGSPPPPPPAAGWFDGFDSETKGYITTRGWDKKKPEEAFLEASKAHREAEKFVGAPADKLLRVPDERTTDTPETRARHAEEWNKIHERLGKPKESKDYDFATVKRAGDKPLDQALTDTLRQAAFDANLNKDSANKVAVALVKHLDAIESAKTAIAADNLVAEKKALNDNWGAAANVNMTVAKAAAAKLGEMIPGLALAVNSFEGQAGYATIMEMFRLVGSKMSLGEDFYVNGGSGGGIMTKDQAIAEKATLMKDKEWGKRHSAGGVEETRKMLTLNKIITGTV